MCRDPANPRAYLPESISKFVLPPVERFNSPRSILLDPGPNHSAYVQASLSSLFRRSKIRAGLCGFCKPFHKPLLIVGNARFLLFFHRMAAFRAGRICPLLSWRTGSLPEDRGGRSRILQSRLSLPSSYFLFLSVDVVASTGLGPAEFMYVAGSFFSSPFLEARSTTMGLPLTGLGLLFPLVTPSSPSVCSFAPASWFFFPPSGRAAASVPQL